MEGGVLGKQHEYHVFVLFLSQTKSSVQRKQKNLLRRDETIIEYGKCRLLESIRGDVRQVRGRGHG